MTIAPDASLIIRAPEKVSLEAIHQFVREKISWITKKQRIARENFIAVPKKEFVEGEHFIYLGKMYPLLITDNGQMPFSFTGKEFLLKQEHHTEARILFTAWYKQRALEFLQERVKFYADQAGLRYSRVKINSAKYRWGSCNTKGMLNFSWRIILAPVEAADYVVVHELAHLAQHNHSKKFWDKVASMLPRYHEAKRWLRKNHYLLEL